MKKPNAFTTIAIFSITVAVLLASVIASSPIAGEGSTAGAGHQGVSLTVPF